MEINDYVLPIVLEYKERGWTEKTVKCLKAAGFELEPQNFADREGVGSMSKAFNERMRFHLQFKNPPFIWFLTNITFEPHVPHKLLEYMQSAYTTAAIHPGFNSDHPHIRQGQLLRDVPFVEWTAPFIRMSALEDVGLLDEQMPYVGFDIDWSYRAKQFGWILAADGVNRVEHTYLYRHAPERISEIRASLRTVYLQSTYDRLAQKWGDNWMEKLCVSKTC